MFNKNRTRLTQTKETHVLSPAFSLQVFPANSLTISDKLNNKQTEEVVFRPTHASSDMRRYPQPGDFQINHFAEKVPIHYRTGHGGKKPVAPSAACAHDLANANVNDVEEGRHSRASSGSAPVKAQKIITSLPGDRVIFAESPSAPGIPVVYRTLEEKSSNPDRLNLDRRKLQVCPILEGEEQLRLLNYQHNFITKIQHLSCLRRLIFLDLYDNQIEEISGLSSLKSLRVLMLGKNRIKKIENLDTLLKLDVLDLHGNQIPEIEGLSHLTDLRVLNLAGNQITHVDNLAGMDSLAELNLRRNHIVTVVDVDALPNLQRLFLSFNEISSFEDIVCLGDSNSLSEISLDGNPIAQEQYYKQIVLRNMQQIKQLDMKRVTEEERRIALVMARKEEEKRREMNKITVMKEKRRLAINNAKRQWETMQGSSINKTSQLVKMPEIYANHVGTVSNFDLKSPSPNGYRIDDGAELESITSDKQGSRPGSSKSGLTENFSGMSLDKQKSSSKKETKSAPLKETMVFPKSSESGSNLNNVADLEGDTLTFYGSGSLESLDKSWGVQAAGAVINIVFRFIDFDNISKHLHKIRTRFPGVQTLTFSSTNIQSLQQINCLSNIRRLDNLTIDIEGNPVTKFTLWRLYTLYRLAHFSLKKINDMDVSPSDIVNAEKLFGSISHVTTSQLPQSRLLLLLGDTTRRKQMFPITEDKTKKISDLKLTDKSQGELVGRAGLSYQSPETRRLKLQEQKDRRHIAKSTVDACVKEAIFVDRKSNELNKFWSQLFHELVHSALIDFTEPNVYMKRCLEELEKG